MILQEIGAAHDTPDDIVFDKFTETAFRHQTIGRSILGTPETVQSFTSEQMHHFIERQYGAERMVVVAAGDIKHDDFVREVESGSAPSAARPTARCRNYAQYVGGDFREDRDLMDAQIILGFEGRAYHVRDFYASQVLSMILGGGMSSRLFQEVREKRGLCYSVYAFHWGFSDTGIFGVHSATGQSDIFEAGPGDRQRTSEGRRKHLPGRTEPRARAVSRRAHHVGRKRSSRASQIARQLLLFGRPIAKEELMERLSALTVERLTRPLLAPVLRQRRPLRRSGRSARSRLTRRSATRFPGRDEPAQARSLTTVTSMFALPFFRRDLPALKGERVTLRLPVPGDYREWAALRSESRAFLEPWEPRWASDELDRSGMAPAASALPRGFRRAALRVAFFIFEHETGKLLGGITLGNIRHGVAQSGHIGYWIGESYAGQGLMVEALGLLARLLPSIR